MKPLLRSFGIFIRQITRDNMLWAVCLAPFITALLFRFGIPYAESLLCAYFQRQRILADYYLLFDLWLCLTPSYMLCFASAMVMLTERDENMAGYMAVTPVGKTGYVLSRLIFPAAIDHQILPCESLTLETEPLQQGATALIGRHVASHDAMQVVLPKQVVDGG